MTETKQIADAYHAVTLKGAWYGPTLAELIAKISPEEAVTPPVPGAHSISELLQHLLMDKIWKMGIIVGAVIIGLVVMVIIYRTVGRR